MPKSFPNNPPNLHIIIIIIIIVVIIIITIIIIVAIIILVPIIRTLAMTMIRAITVTMPTRRTLTPRPRGRPRAVLRSVSDPNSPLGVAPNLLNELGGVRLSFHAQANPVLHPKP